MLKNKGFTLIELIVSLVILAILISFAIPAYNYFKEKSILSLAITMLIEYRQELGLYTLKTKIIPNNQEEFTKFEQQMKFNPNNNGDLNKFYQVKYIAEKNLLLAKPTNNKIYKACAIMELNDNIKIQTCKKCTENSITECTNIND